MISHESKFIGLGLLFAMFCAGLLDAAETASSGKAAMILQQTGVQGGLLVHLDCGNGDLTAALRANEKYLVHGMTRKGSELPAARKGLLGEGVYGNVSLDVYDGKTLPYNDNLVNLIVCEGATSVPEKEILRVLAPLGVAWINGQKTQKPWPSDIDEWNHFLNDPDNNAVAKDTQIGEPRSLQWVMGPKWGRSHEEMASMSACVSAKGRIFYIVDQAPLISVRFSSNWMLVARDAFNGTLLWEREIDSWVDHLRDFRSGPVHLPRRLVAVGDEVYVTRGIDAPVEALDAATGETLRTYAGTAYTDELLCEDGILYALMGSSEIRRHGEGLSDRSEPATVDYRRIEAFDVKSGKKLWKVEPPKEEFVLPLTPAKKGSRLIFQTISRLICVDARTGSKLWETPRETPDKRMAWSALTVVMTEKVVFVADRSATGTANSKKKKGKEEKAKSAATIAPAKSGPVELGVNGWDEPGFMRKDSNVYVTAYDIETGKELWKCPATEGYNSPVDIFVVGSDVWIGSTFSEARDVLTGNVTHTIEDRDGNVGMTHARCHRMKATEKYILHSLSGIEMVDLEKGWLGNNSWVRGTCQYGIMPANGLIYSPPEACACFNKVKLQGFKAISSKTWQQEPEHPLEKGPAYHAKVIEPARGDAWSTYRSTSDRGGTSKSSVATSLKPAWTAAIGGVLTQPVSSGNTVIVAAPDKQTVYAFDAAQGKPLWTYTAGGRIDSSPTLWKDRVLFGSGDGWLYCVTAKDGQLCWRLRGAPAQRLITSFGQLESAWPLFGSVLVQKDTAIIVAGRNTYIDGGLFICAVDVATGTIKATRQLFDLDPETFRQTGKEKKGWFDMDGSLNDILTGTGTSFYLKHLRFDLNLEPMEITQSHLFTPTGFLGNEWYIRSYWLFGNNVGSGYGGWVNVTGGEQVPAARLMVVGDGQIYGYGRATQAGAKAGHTNDDTYHLFSLDKKLTNIPEGSRLDGDIRDNKKLFGKRADTKALNWGIKNELIARAMVLANDQLLVAGYPDIGKRDSQVLSFENEEDAIAAYQGKRGSFLQVVAPGSGEKLSEVKLPAEPVFDGMAVANGRVFVALKDGSLHCLK